MAKQTTHGRSLQPVGGYLKNWSTRDDLVTWEERKSEMAALATQRVTSMFACYRNAEVADSDYYLTAAVGILSLYSENTILRVTDPVNGLPSTSKWLPTLSEIKEACEKLQGEEDRATERDTRRQKQIEDREQWLAEQAAAKPKHKTYEEMKKEAGDNWGLESVDKIKRAEEAARQEHLEYIERAGKRVFELECKAAGVDANRLVSPALEKLLRTKGL